MIKGCWKITEDERAVFIDLDEEDFPEKNSNHVYSRWPELPDLVLEKIFYLLSPRQRYYASLVCRSWYRAFNLPGVWSHFIFNERTLTRGKFNYYLGWQPVLDHLRTSVCLTHIGRHLRELTFEPMHNFGNVYEFMNIMSWFIEQSRNEQPTKQFERIGHNIHAIKFTFPCNIMSSPDQTLEHARLFGTGGKLLEALKRLIISIEDLRRLELIDLMLDTTEASTLLDEVCINSCETLRILSLINVTKFYYPLMHIAVFVNLHTLITSPQTINNDIIEMLSQTRLKKLYLVQNRYTQINTPSVSKKSWEICRRNNPYLLVYLELESVTDKEIIWQEKAPVYSIIYDSPVIKIDPESIHKAIQKYYDTLSIYGHKKLPRFFQPKSFHDRSDNLILMLCKQVPYIHTLIIRERISTSTLLLLATTAKNLRRLYIRRNAVILRSNWPKAPDWSDEYYEWLRSNSRSYEDVEREISKILQCRWRMLTDNDFKNIPIHVHANGYYN